ncbi:penicillin acylase family protein [Paenibacillus sp. GCM10027627]|uniref:penicillin acylase family protein n=1 Tax=unclassified Paenibacillus TaxID=185978 RepID=UPI00363F201F
MIKKVIRLSSLQLSGFLICSLGLLAAVSYLFFRWGVVYGLGFIGCLAAFAAVTILKLRSKADLLSLMQAIGVLRATRPRYRKEFMLDTPMGLAKVTFDSKRVPSIAANYREDAFYAMGYVIASERLFQMDMLRRMASGRMSEIFGAAQLESDREARIIGFHRSAAHIFESLPEDQRKATQAYVRGINQYIGEKAGAHFEFRLLGYKMDNWKEEDCILVLQEMIRKLSGDGSDKRMLTAMKKTMPEHLIRFLTSDDDEFKKVLTGDDQPSRSTDSDPFETIARLLEMEEDEKAAAFVVTDHRPAGSNQWAVSGDRTKDGRAIVACDMHLELNVPNIWFRGHLTFGDTQLSGIFLPGAPLLVAGSTGHVAWGFTRMCGDNLDLVMIERNPENAEEYKTQSGWSKQSTIKESIRVRGKADVDVEVNLTEWGPILHEKILDETEVALRWTALDAKAVDFYLLHMESARSVEDAVQVLGRWGGPPMNAVVGDSSGRIAWTLTGRFPLRTGMSGETAEFWHSDGIGWEGYVPASELPHIIDPPSGILVTANNRIVDSQYPHPIGFNYFNGYRAHRITELLAEQREITERDMHRLQLDTASEFYSFYREIALEALEKQTILSSQEATELAIYIGKWDGSVEADSEGFPLLFMFHQEVAKAVIGSITNICRRADAQFQYSWMNYETPVRAILKRRDHRLLGGGANHWASFLAAKLSECAERIESAVGRRYNEVNWGEANRALIVHPISYVYPELWPIANMPPDPMGGCPHTVNVSWAGFGVSVRFAVSPGKEEDGTYGMPCGQSGHPLSTSYDDHHSSWLKGIPLPFH